MPGPFHFGMFFLKLVRVTVGDALPAHYDRKKRRIPGAWYVLTAWLVIQLQTIALSLMLLVSTAALAQSLVPSPICCDASPPCVGCGETRLEFQAAPPRMSPELALSMYQKRSVRQTGMAPSYTARTVVTAELPDVLQKGEFELRTQYIAPVTLRFTPVHFIGDLFVKSNVINRFLQSEVAHVERQDEASRAISSANYTFAYKRTEWLDGQLVHIYAVKPRKKRPGLFKGEIAVGATTGSLRRAKGALVKSPSFFIRKIEFEQDFADIDGFTVPVRLHSTAKARWVGRVTVDVFTRDYLLVMAEVKEGAPPTAPPRTQPSPSSDVQ